MFMWPSIAFYTHLVFVGLLVHHDDRGTCISSNIGSLFTWDSLLTGALPDSYSSHGLYLPYPCLTRLFVILLEYSVYVSILYLLPNHDPCVPIFISHSQYPTMIGSLSFVCLDTAHALDEKPGPLAKPNFWHFFNTRHTMSESSYLPNHEPTPAYAALSYLGFASHEKQWQHPIMSHCFNHKVSNSDHQHYRLC